MPAQELSDNDAATIRMLVSNRFTELDLPIGQIKTPAILTEATNYVYDALRLAYDPDDEKRASLSSVNIRAIVSGVDEETLEPLPAQETFERFTDTILTDTQYEFFINAIIYRSAANCMPIVHRAIREAGIGTTLEIEEKSWTELQTYMFEKCDELIEGIINRNPDDGFSKKTQVQPLSLFSIS